MPGTVEPTGRSYLRDGKGKFTPDPATAERDDKAMRLRSQGRMYAQIAAALHLSGKASARRCVERGLAATVQESADELRALMDAQLDQLTLVCLGVLGTRHYVVASSGKVARDPVSGEPLMDDGPRLHAVDRLLKVMERRAKPHAVDLPPTTRIDVQVRDEMDEKIRLLMAEMGNPVLPGSRPAPDDADHVGDVVAHDCP